MFKAVLIAVVLTVVGALMTPVMAGGPGTCGRGKVWDPEARKCVPKPRSSGSGSHSLLEIGPGLTGRSERI